MDRREDDIGDLLSSAFDYPRESWNQGTYSYQVDLPGDNLFGYDGKVGEGEREAHDRRGGSEVYAEAEEEVAQAPRVYERYFESSSDEEYYPPSDGIETAGKRLDYMSQFLDRKLSSSTTSTADGGNDRSRYLPEFVGSGGGSDVFTVPVRAAVHPGRPASLEVRPHPLRENESGRALRTIVCSESQLWAGSECGVRFWNFSDLYKPCVKGGEADDTAPFCESMRNESVAICLVADAGNKLIWSGHRDGKIRAWKMDQAKESQFKEVLTWQAHRNPVLSIVLTTYGDLWSGSESGMIMVWPWEAIEKALSLSVEEKHMASLLVERSYIDLRSQVSVNSFSINLTFDVRYLLSDNSRAIVWSGGYMSFALWDARTRELLKVLNTDGQIENRLDMPSAQDLATDDEMKIKFSSSKKEKSQGPVSFFQRSRNAILGAADAVRRVAVKSAFGDDNRRTEAIAIAIDGNIWSGCTSGLLVQWDGNGNRLQDFQYHSHAVQCICTFGSRIWVGYSSGIVQVLDLEGHLLGEWIAHSSSLVKMAVGAGYVFTLAAHGGIRGWNASSPGRMDSMLRSELAGKEFVYTRLEKVKILTGTWNVGQGRASQDSLISWISSAASDVGIIVVGLQEVEMGAGVLAMSAAKETVGLEGSALGQLWLDMIGKTLDEGSTFKRVGSRQLAGLLIAVWVRSEIVSHVGDIDAAAVPCGFGRAIGNKGAVALRMRVYDRVLCFVNCHFAAHLEAVNRRNADFYHVYRTMTFSKPSNAVNSSAVGVSSAMQMLRSTSINGTTAEAKPELSEADMVVFLGDFNYRLNDISYDEARDFVSQRSFDWLRERDQLRAEMSAGNVFQGMREAIIKFPPTYKFERHQPGLAGYDSGEKKRIPAWCDRVLYRDSRTVSTSECSLECPVVSAVAQYEACMDVTDSDHKPVRCIFCVDIARVDESIRRQEFGEIIASNKKINSVFEELCRVPDTIVSTNNIILQNQDTSILRITNKSRKHDAFFEIVSEGQSTVRDDGQALDHCPRGSFGFPRWLKVIPASGIIKPDEIFEVAVHHQDYQTVEEFVDGVPQNWWCEDARDKEVILAVKVHDGCMRDARTHRIRLRHCLATSNASNSKPDNLNNIQSNLLHRSDIQRLSSSSYDVVNKLKNLSSP
ncbi:unnamed protein product [Rhodiola kirilowii]